MPRLLNDPLRRYVFGVILLGLAALVWVMHADGMGFFAHARLELWLLAAAVVLGELLPLRMLHRGAEGEITPSTTFAFALLISAGPVPAVLAQIAGSAFSDVLHRKPVERIAFNVAQYVLSLGAGGAVLWLLSDVPRLGVHDPFGPADLPAILLSAAVFFVVNAALVARAVALSQGVDFWKFLPRDIVLQTSTVGILLGLAPIVVLAMDFSPVVLPLLGLPLLAVHRAGREAVNNEHHALHDGLTGLPNRTLLRDRIEQAIRLARGEGTGAAVMLIDLDRFKEVNDTLGHHHGDLLLERIGPRLRGVLREGDTVARLGGDEFAVVLPRAGSVADSIRVAAELRRVLAEPYRVHDLQLHVTGSVGIACFPDHGEDVDALVQHADVAMYQAKGQGTGHAVYSAANDRNTRSSLRLAGELPTAIDRGELVLHYQPKAALASGHVEGVEALMRWQHPERGLLPPSEFIPIAERTGLIGAATMYAIDAALLQCSVWLKSGLRLSVAVNLPAHSLIDPELPDHVLELLQRWDVAPELLELEITESTIMGDPARAMAVLTRLSEMGIRLTIDDFGTGYSSLAYLKRLPVDEIKIDRSFVQGMGHESADAAIVRSTIDLAHNLGLRVVAEGVETSSQWDDLRRLRCDLAQGFLLSPPIPADEIAEWLAAWSDDALAEERAPAMGALTVV